MAVLLRDTETPVFPDTNNADEYGLLAVGGRLSVEWLLNAYSKGIFPWFNEGDPILWWFPHERAVMKPSDIKVHKSMRSIFNQKKFELRIDSSFENVIKKCASIKRPGHPGTWIISKMQKAYTELFKAGYAHSFETWENNKLIGGLYGVSLGKIFFGESMFSEQKNASKFAFISMCKILEKQNFNYVDCQIPTQHLQFMGCGTMAHNYFERIITENRKLKTIRGSWAFMTETEFLI